MRGSSLQAIRARVDRLAISVGAAGCGESHVRLHISPPPVRGPAAHETNAA